MAGALPDALLATVCAALGPRALPDEPLARHTSFRIGGPADLLVLPDTAAELAAILAATATHRARVTLLGGGSNVLVGDEGIRGVVVKLGRGFARTAWDETAEPPRVRAGAAVKLGRLARAAVEHGLAGLEYAEGIPGTVGGALFMNAGAYGGDLAGAVEAVEGVLCTGEVMSIEREALAFRYRRAELPPGFVVTAVAFRLRHEDAGSVRARMDAVRDRRLAAQPNGSANAGSIFKNPERDHAGRLIEVAGLKGARAGRARISERHANFIVNEGGARAADVKALMDLAQRVVWERSGVWLEPEVQLVGSW
jgi:UDP-N-acetylmuramate dehydrogenase